MNSKYWAFLRANFRLRRVKIIINFFPKNRNLHVKLHVCNKFHEFISINSKKMKKTQKHFFYINFGVYTYFWLKTARIVLEKFQKQIWVSKRITIWLIYHSILKSKIFLKFFLGKNFFRGTTISIWIYPKWCIFILNMIYILKAEVKIL